MEPPLKFMGVTTDLLRELNTKHIDLLETELRELLKEWGFVQKSVWLNGEPRRAWNFHWSNWMQSKRKLQRMFLQ